MWSNQLLSVDEVLSEEGEKRTRHYPAWQRNKVWKQINEQHYLTSVFAKENITPMYFFPGEVDGIIVTKILDGKQRTETLHKFKRNQIAVRLPGMKHPTFHDDLAEGQRAQFYARSLQITLIQESDEGVLRRIYQNINSGTPLTRAELMYAFDSHAHSFADDLRGHAFFRNIYCGDTIHMSDFRMALATLVLEAKGPIGISVPVIESVSQGHYDAHLNEALKERAVDHLFDVCNVFDGVQTRAQTSIVLMLLTAQLLRHVGCNLQMSEAGALRDWYMKVIDDHSSSYDHSSLHTSSLLSQFTRISIQLAFFERQLPQLIRLPGLHRQDHDPIKLERLIRWCAYRRVCPSCQQVIGDINLIHRHAFRSFDDAQGACLEIRQRIAV